jgi:hypothetical protein
MLSARLYYLFSELVATFSWLTHLSWSSFDESGDSGIDRTHRLWLIHKVAQFSGSRNSILMGIMGLMVFRALR